MTARPVKMTAMRSVREMRGTGHRVKWWAAVAPCVLAWLVLVPPVAAAPTVRLTSSVAHGPLGDDAQLRLAMTFTGTEYGGFTPPLNGLTFHLPFVTGALAGLVTCERSVLEPTGPGPRGCPRASRAGPPGTGNVDVAFGSEIIPEAVSTEAFYGPGGQIFALILGHTPAAIESIATGTLQTDATPYATALRFAFPPIETVPGAPLASTRAITLDVGTPTEGSPPNGVFLLPGACPASTLPLSAEASFNGEVLSSSSSAVACTAAVAPPPAIGRREDASVTAGTVLVRLRGSSTFVALAGPAGIPDGSELDTTAGTVEVTAATSPGGATQSAEVHGGVFLVHQVAAATTTDLALTGALSGCRAPARTASAGRHTRHLWVSEHGGRWETKGRYVSTSVEGTSWLTTDSCRSSTVRVSRGRVAVRDLVNGRTTILTAGRSLTVRPNRHRQRAHR